MVSNDIDVNFMLTSIFVTTNLSAGRLVLNFFQILLWDKWYTLKPKVINWHESQYIWYTLMLIVIDVESWFYILICIIKRKTKDIRIAY